MRISDQERLWRERSKEREPVFYEYPKTGHQGVVLYKEGSICLVQLNDYEKRIKTYLVLEEDSILIETKVRHEADTVYNQALVALNKEAA